MTSGSLHFAGARSRISPEKGKGTFVKVPFNP